MQYKEGDIFGNSWGDYFKLTSLVNSDSPTVCGWFIVFNDGLGGFLYEYQLNDMKYLNKITDEKEALALNLKFNW